LVWLQLLLLLVAHLCVVCMSVNVCRGIYYGYTKQYCVLKDMINAHI
jgi:hypothetical protein